MTKMMVNPIVAFLLFTGISYSTTINVPADQATIQAGIDAAVDGDTVLIANGTYMENVVVEKQLTIMSENGADNTVINGNGLIGLDILGGNPGGVHGITFTNADQGLRVSYSDSYYVTNCIFTDNNYGLLSHGTTAIIVAYSLFSGNQVGYLEIYYGFDCAIINSTFDNVRDIWFEPSYGSTAKLDISNSIFLGQIDGYATNPVNLYYCDYAGGNLGVNVTSVTGNITGDPLFADPINGNYNLQPGSPCVDAGDPISFSNDGDASRNDMGLNGGSGIIIVNSEISFGYVAGNSSIEKFVKLTNFSNNSITISNYSSSDNQFGIGTILPATINQGQNINLSFLYEPDVAGPASGTITFDVIGLYGVSDAAFIVSGHGISYSDGVIEVPGVAPTIQSAVDIASNGDTIRVASGTYYENVLVNKQLIFTSESGSDSTVIDGNGLHGIEILGGNPGSLSGFTFENCNVGLQLTECYSYEVNNSQFINNVQGLNSHRNTNLHISKSLFFGNNYGYVEGYYGLDVVIENCTFDNINDILFQPSYGTTVELNIYNSVLLGQIDGHDLNPVNLFYCNYVEDHLGINVNAVEGNITDDPLFVDQSNNNYNLQVLSPCINAGNPDLDADGELWSIDQDDQDPDGSRLDIGAYYLHHTNVWIVDSEYFAGDTVMIPIMVEFAPDSSYSSVAMKLGSYYNYIEFLGLNTENTLISDGWTYQLNESDTVLTIWFAGSNNISGGGELCNLSFYIPDTAHGIIPLTILSAVFDEGFYPTILSSGISSIYDIDYGDVSRNGEISPFDASLILKHLVGVEDLDWRQLYNADVTLDSTISALDASFILQYGVGLIDTLPYSEPALAQGDVQMNDEELEVGSDISIPLLISNGSNVLSFEGTITFDPNSLIFQDIIWSELLDDFAIEISVEEGRINFAGAGSTPDGEAGVFSTINFTPQENFANDQTTVSLASLRWNEGETQIDVASSTVMSVVSIEGATELPRSFTLRQNYPNPFNPTTTISYGLPENADVSIIIYDIKGREVRTLVQTNQSAGWHDVAWDGITNSNTMVSTGVYFARIIAGGNFTDVIKMVYLQ